MASLGTLNGASPIDASNNSYLSFTADTTETLSRALDNTPTDLLSMTTVSWQVEYSITAAPSNDTYDLAIRIVNGATILAAADSGGTFATVQNNVTNTTDTTSSATAFSYINTGASKTTWDGASIELSQTYSKQAGPDGQNIQVDYVAITGTYQAGNSLTATSIESVTEVNQPAITQTHALVATTIESVTEVNQPTFSQVSDLIATSIESVTEVNQPVLGEAHPLTALSVESITEVNSPALSQTHNLVATSIESLTEVPSLAIDAPYAFYVNMPVGYLGFYVRLPDQTPSLYGTATYGNDPYSPSSGGFSGEFNVNLPVG